MVKKSLKNEVKRLREELKNSKKLYKEIDEYSGKLYDNAMVSALEIIELKKEICELQKSVDVPKSERPKNYGVKMNVYGEPIKFLKSTDDLIMTVRLDEAVRMTNETAVHLARMYNSASENDHYRVFSFLSFPTYEELEAALKLDSIPNDDIIEIDKTEQYGTAVGETCNRPCKGKIVKHSNGKINCYNCMDYL